MGHLVLRLAGRSVVPHQGWLQAYVLSLAMGLSLLSLIPYAMNLAQLDVRPFFWAFYSTGIAYLALQVVRSAWQRNLSLPPDPFDEDTFVSGIAILALIVLAITSLIILLALNQGNDWDAIQLYLPMGRIVFEKGILPVHSPQIGRDIINFFLMGYVYGYAMTISGSFLYPPAILGIVLASFLGLVAVTYEISSRFLRTLADRLLASASLVTLPLIAYYFAWIPHYADIPSVFLAFGLAMFALNSLAAKGGNSRKLVARNLAAGVLAFTAIGFKLQNLLILPLLLIFLFESLSTRRARFAALGILFVAFALSIIWTLAYGTVFGGLSAGGIESPILVIVIESSTMLLLFGVLVAKTPEHLVVSGSRSFLPGSMAGLALWFARPTLIRSTPFFPVTLPGGPEFAFAKDTYSAIVGSLFTSPFYQYGVAVPYTSPYLAPLLFPLIVVGAYALLRRNQLFMLKWVFLLVGAAAFATGFVDTRYALWVAPLSGILLGESTFFLRRKLPSHSKAAPLVPLVLMSLGLGVISENPTIQTSLLPFFAIVAVAGALYFALIVLSLPARPSFKSIATFHPQSVKLAAALLLACLSLSFFSITYVKLVIDDSTDQARQSQYEQIYVFLESNVPRGSTVLSIGFPGIYYRTGLSSIPLDDPEGLARLYPFTIESNVSLAAVNLSQQINVSSIVVPNVQNVFWYGYFGSMRNRVPLMVALTSEPISRLGFADNSYDVYLLAKK